MILESLGQLSQRPVIVMLAIIEAVLATLGADALAHRLRLGPRGTRWLCRCGYGAMWASVALFIVAGFLPSGAG